MSLKSHSDVFNLNFIVWKIFGIWPGKKPSKYYKYYSFIYLLNTLFVYNILLTVNLLYTPLKIDLLVREVIFFFTEIAVTCKVLMIIFMRNEIMEALQIFDCDEFQPKDTGSKQIIEKFHSYYNTYWRMYVGLANLAYSFQVLVTILVHFIFKSELLLPICRYYFLSDDIRHAYFTYWYLYQSFGMYGHMMYNVNVDSFISGLIAMAVTQLKVLNLKLVNLKLQPQYYSQSVEIQDRIQVSKLKDCLKHYDIIRKFCFITQEIQSITMFVQFSMASMIICVGLCGFILPSSTDTTVFMVTYLLSMIAQIFVPGWLGSQLVHESQKLAFAAYSCEWMPRSEKFKRNLRLFVERANIPLQLTGLKIFPLSLSTFTSILKTAYSFFALVKNVHDREKINSI